MALAITPPPLTTAETTAANGLAATIEANFMAVTDKTDDAAVLAALQDSIINSGVSPAVAKEALALALASLTKKNLATKGVLAAFDSVGKVVQAAIDNGLTTVRTASITPTQSRTAANNTPSSVNGGVGGGGQHTVLP